MKTKFKLLVSLIISVIMIGSQFAVLSGNVYAVENKPTLKVGVSAGIDGYYPYEYYENNELVGFDIDLINEIAKRIGYNVEFVDVDFSALFPMLENNKLDCCISAIIATEDIRYFYKEIDFSIPYIIANTEWIEDGTTLTSTEAYSILTRKNLNLKRIIDNSILDCINDRTIENLAKKYGIDIQLEEFKNEVNSLISNRNTTVKDIMSTEGGNFIVLMENGRLYKGNSIDTGNPELIAENKDSIEDTPTAPKEYAEKIKDGIKHYYPSNYAGKSDFIISNANELIAIKKNGNDFTIKTILTDVKDIIYQSYLSSLHLVILRNNGDLFCLQNIHNENQNLVRICGEVNSIDKVAIDGHYLTYIDRYDDAFYCYLNKENISPVKYHDNASEVFLGGGSGDERTLISKDGYVESFPWTTETTPRSKVYGYTKVITLAPTVMHDDFFEDIYGRCCIYNGPYAKNPVFDVYNVKKAVELKDSYLFLTEDGKLYGAFEDEDASIVGTFETIFSQKRTIVKINKKEVALKDKIQIVDGRSMYPFRECLENMGATVYYDSVNGIAVGEYNGTKIEFPINKNEYWINGNKYEMDVFSYIDASIGRTYIPIRYAAEGLGFTVDWIPGDIENTISIHK